VRTFLVPLREHFYGKYLSHYLKMDVGGGAETEMYKLYDEHDVVKFINLDM
jgi:hypothetical protein